MKSFRIGEFAKRHGISVQLLKNYDQQGILRPFMRDETGRYYLDSQSVELIEKQYLTGTGLSLQESRKLCDMGSLADWSAHLSQVPAFIENEIRERQTLLQFTHEINSLIKEIQEKAPWRIEPWDGGKYIPRGNPRRIPGEGTASRSSRSGSVSPFPTTPAAKPVSNGAPSSPRTSPWM